MSEYKPYSWRDESETKPMSIHKAYEEMTKKQLILTLTVRDLALNKAIMMAAELADKLERIPAKRKIFRLMTRADLGMVMFNVLVIGLNAFSLLVNSIKYITEHSTPALVAMTLNAVCIVALFVMTIIRFSR